MKHRAPAVQMKVLPGVVRGFFASALFVRLRVVRLSLPVAAIRVEQQLPVLDGDVVADAGVLDVPVPPNAAITERAILRPKQKSRQCCFVVWRVHSPTHPRPHSTLEYTTAAAATTTAATTTNYYSYDCYYDFYCYSYNYYNDYDYCYSLLLLT